MSRRATKKSLAQHFLIDGNVIQEILDRSDAATRHVLEIGPGTGALTAGLIQKFSTVTLVEKDSGLCNHWRQQAESNVTVIEADAAEEDWIDHLVHQPCGVVSNLPYNAATPILRTLLGHYDYFPWMVLMFQKEVADRILYAGQRQGGPMGILAQLVYDVTDVGIIPPHAFDPPPRVDSRVIYLQLRANPLPNSQISEMWSLLLALFQRRRARLDSQVARFVGVDRDTVQDWFNQLAIRQDARADHVQADQYRDLATIIWNLK